MSDAASDTISLMMKFGQSVIPAAGHLAEILLDAVKTLLKGSMGLGKMRAGKVADSLKDQIDGIGEHGHIALKNLARQGRELMVIPIEREDLKTLKAQLKNYYVDFAVQEDAMTGDISIHVKAQDLARIETALKGVIRSNLNEQQVDLSEQQPKATEEQNNPSEKLADLLEEKESLEEDINFSYDFGDSVNAKEVEAQLAQVESELAEINPEGDMISVRNMPATENQMYFINDLRMNGCVSADEMNQFKQNQTLGAANDLLNAHRDEEVFIALGAHPFEEEIILKDTGIPKGYEAEEVETLYGKDHGTGTFNHVSEKPFVVLAPNVVMRASAFDSWYQRAQDGEKRAWSDGSTTREDFAQRIARPLDRGSKDFEFENEKFDISEARDSGALSLSEHDWDKLRDSIKSHPDGTYEQAMKSEKVTKSGFTLQAYDDGHAYVIDERGLTVWSACTIPGDIDVSKRLAERGLDTYQHKESLQLSSEHAHSGDANSFAVKLDKAEAAATREADKTMVQAHNHERERNAR